MSGCLSCFAKCGGLLLYRKSYGDLSDIPLPVLATLNSTQDYLEARDTECTSLSTEDHLIVWREFHHRLRFVLIVKKTRGTERRSAEELERHLDLLWLALIATCGKTKLVDCENLDLLRVVVLDAAGLLDFFTEAFLEETDLGLAALLESSLMAHCWNPVKLTTIMDSFTASIGVPFAFLLLPDRSATHSSSTDNLTANERHLLTCCCALQLLRPAERAELVSAMESVSRRSSSSRSRSIRSVASVVLAADKLIFLPDSSPDLAYRYFLLEYFPGVIVGFLSGADFKLDDLVRAKIDSFWRAEVDTLKILSELPPKWIAGPLVDQFPKTVYGIVLLNAEFKRIMVSPVSVASSQERTTQRRSHLVNFVRLVLEMRRDSDATRPPVTEMYAFFYGFKFYWLQRNTHEIFALFDGAAGRQDLRGICENLLTLLTTRQNKKTF